MHIRIQYKNTNSCIFLSPHKYIPILDYMSIHILCVYLGKRTFMHNEIKMHIFLKNTYLFTQYIAIFNVLPHLG